MATIDASIPLQAKPIQFQTPFELQAQMSQIQQGQNQNRLANMQFAEAERANVERNQLRDAYSQSMGADGVMDQNKLYGILAKTQGDKIPGIQKAYNDAQSSSVKLTNDKLEGQKRQDEITNDQRMKAAQKIGAHLNDPNLSRELLISDLTNQVQSGELPQDKAQGLIAQIPQDPAEIKVFLNKILTGMQTPQQQIVSAEGASAAKSLEANRKATLAQSEGQSLRVDRRARDLNATKAEENKSKREDGWKYDAGSDEWVAPPSAEQPQGQRSGSIAKSNAAASMDYVIKQFRDGKDEKGGVIPGALSEATVGGPMGIYGRVGAITNSQKTMRFDNLKEQMSTELRTLFRIPGEGTLTDKEQAQYGMQLPNVKFDKATNDAILKDVETRVKLRNNMNNNSFKPVGAGGSVQYEKTATNPQTGQKIGLRNGQWVPVQ